MKNKRGISKLGLFLIIAIIIVAAMYWAKYFAKPMATVMMGGAEQAQPAIEKAHKASESVSQTIKVEEEATKKMNEEADKEK